MIDEAELKLDERALPMFIAAKKQYPEVPDKILSYAVIISGCDNFCLSWDGYEAAVTQYRTVTVVNLGTYSIGEKGELRKNGVNIEKKFIEAGGNALITKYSRHKVDVALDRLENKW